MKTISIFTAAILCLFLAGQRDIAYAETKSFHSVKGQKTRHENAPQSKKRGDDTNNNIASSATCDAIKQVKTLGNSIVHIPEDGVNYVPDAGVNYGAFQDAFKLQDPISIPITIDVLKYMNIDTYQGMEGNANLANVLIYSDGRIVYNGEDITKNFNALCEEK